MVKGVVVVGKGKVVKGGSEEVVKGEMVRKKELVKGVRVLVLNGRTEAR